MGLNRYLDMPVTEVMSRAEKTQRELFHHNLELNPDVQIREKGTMINKANQHRNLNYNRTKAQKNTRYHRIRYLQLAIYNSKSQ